MSDLAQRVAKIEAQLETARSVIVQLQDENEQLKAKLSTRARKNASKRNGLKGGRPKKER
jgi:cell division protein FtsB